MGSKFKTCQIGHQNDNIAASLKKMTQLNNRSVDSSGTLQIVTLNGGVLAIWGCIY